MSEQHVGITGIRVSGFKSIGEASIEIRPLTILAGANSSGKTSNMQPMLLMKQTLDATYDPGPLLLYGPHVKFTQFEQFLHDGKDGCPQTLTTGFQIGQDTFLSSDFHFYIENDQQQRRMELTRMSADAVSEHKVLTTKMTEEEIMDLLPLVHRMRIETEKKDSEKLPEILPEHELRIGRSRCFLQVEWILKIRRANITSVIPFPVNPTPTLQNALQEMIHIPGLRGNLERTYPITPAPGPNFPGEFRNYLASLILHWHAVSDGKLEDVWDNLHSLKLADWVITKPVSDVDAELLVSRTLVNSRKYSEENSVNIADVGFGVSQILPVLVALAVAESGQLVYIEQPELHLHPHAQVELAKVLADAANRGVRIVIETHSALLLQGILTLIAEEAFSPEHVMLHWFQRDKRGKTSINSVSPDENGAYGNWPVDFGDIRLGIQRQYLDAVATKKRGM